jgi:phage terminase large subunit-like protein
MIWTTACPDWQSRIIAGQSLIPCPPLFPDHAAYALSIFKQLRIYDLQGQPTMGEVSEPWVFDFVSAVFGAYDPEIGRRLILEFLLLIAKKNTKSTVAAALMLTEVIVNWRHGAEFLILAPTIEVAGNSYTPARWMVKLDEDLDAMFHVQDHLRTITHRDNGTVLKVVAADKDTVSGKKATGVLIDELWLFGDKPNAENMLAEATGGQASRPEGFTIYLTTQSDKAPAGVFRKKLQYARGVRDGKIHDPAFMPILYEFPPQMVKDEAYKDPKNFYITNPNLGVSVDIPFIERKYRTAVEDGEESLCGFMAKHLNVEVGMVMRSQQWVGADFWRANVRLVTLDEIFRRCDVITIGGDGGGLDDLLGMCVLGRDKDDPDLWLAFFRAWIHPIALERRKSEATKYTEFHEAGEMVIVDHIGQDVDEFCAIVMLCENCGLLERIGVDPSGIADVVNKLKLLGFEDDRIIGVSQGWRLTSSIKDTERKLAAGKLHHGGLKLMDWCVSNAKVEPKGNAILVTKAASGTGKIDPVIALFGAVALMVLNPEPRNTGNIYETLSLIS